MAETAASSIYRLFLDVEFGCNRQVVLKGKTFTLQIKGDKKGRLHDLYEIQKRKITDDPKLNEQLRDLFSRHGADLDDITSDLIPFSLSFREEEDKFQFLEKCNEDGSVEKELDTILITSKMRKVANEAGCAAIIKLSLPGDDLGELEMMLSELTLSPPSSESSGESEEDQSPVHVETQRIAETKLNKYDKFLAERMGRKLPVTALPGIGKVTGKRLTEEGITKATEVYKKFLELKKSEDGFVHWLKKMSVAHTHWALDCYKCLQKYDETFGEHCVSARF